MVENYTWNSTYCVFLRQIDKNNGALVIDNWLWMNIMERLKPDCWIRWICYALCIMCCVLLYYIFISAEYWTLNIERSVNGMAWAFNRNAIRKFTLFTQPKWNCSRKSTTTQQNLYIFFLGFMLVSHVRLSFVLRSFFTTFVSPLMLIIFTLFFFRYLVVYFNAFFFFNTQSAKCYG